MKTPALTEWSSSGLLASQDEAIRRLGVTPKVFTSFLLQKRIKRHSSGVFLKSEIERLEAEIVGELGGTTTPAILPAGRPKQLSLQ